MGADAANKQYGSGVPVFGMDGAMFADTGAPGTEPPGAGIDAGQGGVNVDTGTPVTITPSGASLVNADVVRVGPGDTTLPSQVQAYGASPDPLTGIGAPLGATGAGMGSVSTPHHPNSMSRPS